MESFKTLDAVAVPLDQANMDTDQIIPHASRPDRGQSRSMALSATCATTGTGGRRPEFVLNRPDYARRTHRGREPQLRLRLVARERRGGHGG